MDLVCLNFQRNWTPDSKLTALKSGACIGKTATEIYLPESSESDASGSRAAVPTPTQSRRGPDEPSLEQTARKNNIMVMVHIINNTIAGMRILTIMIIIVSTVIGVTSV